MCVEQPSTYPLAVREVVAVRAPRRKRAVSATLAGMNWHLQCSDGRTLALASDTDVTVGAAGNASLRLPNVPEHCATLHCSDDDAWLQVPTSEVHVGVNGRPVQRLARLRAGDRICFGSVCVDLVASGRQERVGSDVADFFLRVRSGAGSGSVHRGPVLHLDTEGHVVSAAAGVVGLILADGSVRLDPSGARVRLNGLSVEDEVTAVDGDQIQLGQCRYIVETLAAPPPEMITQRLPDGAVPRVTDTDEDASAVPAAHTSSGLWGLILLAAVIASGVAVLLYFHNH